jgi:hypothetical protein
VVPEAVAIEGASAGYARYGRGRAAQIRIMENKLTFRVDVKKPITHLNIEGRLFGYEFNFHFPKF